MYKPLLSALLFLLPFTCTLAGESMPYEIPRTTVISVENSETNSSNTLYIKLPENYTDNIDTRYPVIYFTDPVQHIEILSAATELLMEGVILVGVSWQKDMKYGKEASYLNFFRNDVIAHIEKNYRTDPARRSYFGYSGGAVFGAYTLAERPETFKNYILGSPAFSRTASGKKTVFELGSKPEKRDRKLHANIFVSYGSEEKASGEHIEEFVKMMNSREDKSVTLKSIVVDGDHRTAFPMTAVQSVIWLSSLSN